MQFAAAGKICPSCGFGDSATAILCNCCGKELNPDHYRIVQDGANFGIALNGRVIFNDLTLNKAHKLAMILNGDIESVEAGAA
jgi:hypothetical protein